LIESFILLTTAVVNFEGWSNSIYADVQPEGECATLF
jgi:hypothetical protein